MNSETLGVDVKNYAKNQTGMGLKKHRPLSNSDEVD